MTWVPSASPLSVVLDGPGLFVLESGANRAYSRLGDFLVDESGALRDGHGRAVLGVSDPNSESAGALKPIVIDRKIGASEITIDGHGVVSGSVTGTRKALARIAVATFPAPERMARLGDTALLETRSSGMPRFAFPGDANLGGLRSHALECGLVDLDGDLARLWRLRQSGELLAAQKFADDECERSALGLVK